MCYMNKQVLRILEKMIMNGNIDVKYTSPKILCLNSMGEKTFMKYPG